MLNEPQERLLAAAKKALDVIQSLPYERAIAASTQAQDALVDAIDAIEKVGNCWRCGGAGFIVACIDDLCRGAGGCMHGDDGEAACPECRPAAAVLRRHREQI